MKSSKTASQPQLESVTEGTLHRMLGAEDLQPDDNYFMAEALKLAREAYSEGEVPVGAVVVREGHIIATGHNRREGKKNALYHAEIEAINNACQTLGGWRLCGCELFVTLEPCPMCAGAIINSRIERLVFGAHDKKAGSCGSVINLFEQPYNHKPEVKGGVLWAECAKVLTAFFKELRTQ